MFEEKFNNEVNAEEIRILSERFPHVIAKLKLLWDSELVGGYLESLLTYSDVREDTSRCSGEDRRQRQGFPQEAMAELLYLLGVANKLGYIEVKPYDIWEDGAKW